MHQKHKQSEISFEQFSMEEGLKVMQCFSQVFHWLWLEVASTSIPIDPSPAYYHIFYEELLGDRVWGRPNKGHSVPTITAMTLARVEFMSDRLIHLPRSPLDSCRNKWRHPEDPYSESSTNLESGEFRMISWRKAWTSSAQGLRALFSSEAFFFVFC